MDLAKRSYLALAKVLDLLKWENQSSTADRLEVAINVHVTARLHAYGEAQFPPKCHYSAHLPLSLRKHRLLSCWVHERKHKELKKYASDSNNCNLSNSFEKGLLRQVVLAQLNSLQDLSIGEGCRMIKASPAAPSLHDHVRRFLGFSPIQPLDVKCSKQAFLDAASKCAAKDVVVAVSGDVECVGEVWLFVEANGEQLVCWSPWVTLGNNRFTPVDDPQFMNMQSIKRCCIYSKERSGNVLVVP